MRLLLIHRKRHKTASLLWSLKTWGLGRHKFATCTHYRIGPLLITVDA